MALKTQQERQLMIVEECQEAQTIQELADLWGVSYHTIYRDVKLLEKQGKLKELPFRRDRAIQYMSSGTSDEDGIFTFRSGSKDYTLSEIIWLAERAKGNFQRLSRSLAHLYMRSYGELAGEEHLKGVVSMFDTKESFRLTLTQLKKWVAWVETMLLMDDLWKEDNGELVRRFGPANAEKVKELAMEFNDQTLPYRPGE